ncbi:MAG: GWxTD domain-containing protein [Bacteroidota bacterium]
MRRVALTLMIVLVAFGEFTHSQIRPRPEAFTEPQVFFYEAINLPVTEHHRSRVDIQYRIAEEFFVAVLNADRSLHSPFKRSGEVLMELIDSNGISRARDIDQFVIGATTSERDFGQPQWKQGTVSFTVPPGRYTILVEVDDLESERRFVERTRTIQAKAFDLNSAEFSTPVFLKGSFTGQQFPKTTTPMNHGGDILFAADAGIFIQLASDVQVNPISSIRLLITTGNEDEDPVIVQSDTLTEYPVIHNPRLIAHEDTSGIRYEVSAQDSGHGIGIIIPLETRNLSLRKYDLTATIVHSGGETIVHLPFRTMWPDMPFSLRDVDFAIAVLRYITKPEQLDSLKDGSFEERREKLEQFWKAKDKTPNTVYNEVMTEYYRRVDYSMRTFGTLKEPDGSRSDRGRIHILHGQPTTIERVLDPKSGYEEVWAYTGINKKFVFADETKSGNYILVSTQTL